MANAMLGLVAQRVVHANPVLVLLNNDSNDACTKVRMVKKRYTKRAKCISNKELQRMDREKQQECEDALRQIKAIYPQC